VTPHIFFWIENCIIFARHYGENPESDWGPEQDLNSTKVIRDVLRWEHPDFVVFTGDQVTGEFMYPNVTEYMDILLRPLVDGGYRCIKEENS
jgi:hypothetical protein